MADRRCTKQYSLQHLFYDSVVAVVSVNCNNVANKPDQVSQPQQLDPTNSYDIIIFIRGYGRNVQLDLMQQILC